MKLIIFLTFAISCFAQSEIDPHDLGFSLALAPLELFLKVEKETVSHCYKANKDAYENSIIDFLQKREVLSSILFDEAGVSSKSLDYITGGLKEMENIGNSLNNFFGELKQRIFNGKLIDGGKTIFRQRNILESFFKKYKEHGSNLKVLNKEYYDKNFPQMDAAFRVILQVSETLINKVLKCLEKDKVTYTKTKAN